MNRLKDLRKAKRLTQIEVAQIVGISQNGYSNWETGRNKIDNVSAAKLSELFGVTIDELFNAPTPRKKGIKIPVLGEIRAGVPVEAIEEILDYEEITEEMARQGEFFALKIQGDSMEPRIKEGDVVIVLKQSDVESGQVAIVLVNGEDATCKKFVKHEDGISLVSFNQAYDPMFYTWKEAKELPIDVLGKVVELRGKF